ncbi:hypothetical protein DIPPA_21428 [Diplonema papillatum]|nr:hypothetical protein DIPPA_17168 [Diplonema papillatum]KAJ9455431.1 hypothetical protein DIPPA_21428 [Diplonema papillatum]
MLVDCEGKQVPPEKVKNRSVLSGTDDVPLEIVDVEGKGKGLFNGPRYCIENEVVWTESGILISATERVSGRFEDANTSAAIAALDLQGFDPGPAGTRKMLDAYAFSVPGADASALYDVISRVNHSCAPNCVVEVAGDGTASLRAVAKVPKHTEFTVSYCRVAHGWGREERRRALKAIKSFWCNCPWCSAPGEDPFDGHPTDAQRTFLRGNREQVVQFSLSHDPESGVARSLEEYIAGLHALGELVGYGHWTCAFAARGLLINSTAALEELKDPAWATITLVLVDYFLQWCVAGRVYLPADHQPSWLVQLLYAACHQLLLFSCETSLTFFSPAVQQIALRTQATVERAYHFIQKWHALSYGPMHADSLEITSFLRSQGVDYAQGDPSLAIGSIDAAPLQTISVNDSSLAIVRRHTQRLVKELRKGTWKP